MCLKNVDLAEDMQERLHNAMPAFNAFLLNLQLAFIDAVRSQEGICMESTEAGTWLRVYDDDSGTPELLLEVSPDGSVALVDNRNDCNGKRGSRPKESSK